MNVAIDGPAQSTWEQGKEIYYTRYGQLELACANCHEDNYGNYIRADHLSQGQTNGFPAYRLKNTKLNGDAQPLQGLRPRHPWRKPSPKARRNSSRWNFTSPRAATVCRSKARRSATKPTPRAGRLARGFSFLNICK